MGRDITHSCILTVARVAYTNSFSALFCAWPSRCCFHACSRFSISFQMFSSIQHNIELYKSGSVSLGEVGSAIREEFSALAGESRRQQSLTTMLFNWHVFFYGLVVENGQFPMFGVFGAKRELPLIVSFDISRTSMYRCLRMCNGFTFYTGVDKYICVRIFP